VSDKNEDSKDKTTIIAEHENNLLLAEKSGNRVDIANMYLSKIIEEKRLQIEKDKDEEFKNILLRYELSLLNDLHEIFNQINSKLDEFKSSRDHQNKMANAEKSGDFDALRLTFINEYGMDADKVKAMSEQELREQRIAFDELEQQRQAVIISDIRELANEYRKHAALLGEINPVQIL